MCCSELIVLLLLLCTRSLRRHFKRQVLHRNGQFLHTAKISQLQCKTFCSRSFDLFYPNSSLRLTFSLCRSSKRYRYRRHGSNARVLIMMRVSARENKRDRGCDSTEKIDEKKYLSTKIKRQKTDNGAKINLQNCGDCPTR